MKFLKKVNFILITKVFISSIAIVLTVSGVVMAYVYGYGVGVQDTEKYFEESIANIINEQIPATIVVREPSKTPIPQPQNLRKIITWGGPELWELVNKARVENGVNPLSQRDELCTIATIRLNELLELGKLDNHEGFSDMPERRPDLKWIFDKYVIAEFLLSGAETAQEAVDLWYNTLGHKKLITGGEYSYGCIYAQSGFAVAIAAY